MFYPFLAAILPKILISILAFSCFQYATISQRHNYSSNIIITTFSQDTKNRYDMFEEFMSQSSTELVARNQAIDNLLQESNSKNSVFREKQRSCLNQLMETVVKGLDTAVEMRDSQHGIITTNK